MEALEKQYADVISPLKENLAPKKLSFKYIQKLTKRAVVEYEVPKEASSNTFFNLILSKVCLFLLKSFPGAAGNFIEHYEENA